MNTINSSYKKRALCAVVLLHVMVIYCCVQKYIKPLTKPIVAAPMMVSLIAQPAPEPVLLPVIERTKPIIESKPKVKNVVKEIKPIEVPTERLVEATTQDVKELTSTPSIQPQEETVAVKAPAKTEPVVEEKIEPPKFGVAYLNNPAPTYPALSRRMGEEGRALLRVLVSENGEATEVQLEKSSGSDRLDQAAIDAVKVWRFIPARKGSQSLSAYVLVPIKFSLNS